MKLPLHTEKGAGRYVDLIDTNGATVALDLTPVSAAEIVRAINDAEAQVTRIATLKAALETALRQWRSYANEREGENIETAKHLEGDMYRHAAAALLQKEG